MTWPGTAASSAVDDLAQYRAIERRPLTGRYRDHQIYSAPPPVSTGATLIETLQILQNYQPKAGAYVHDRRRLSALRHRVVAGARSGSANRRPGAVGRHARTASRARRMRQTLFKRIDPAKAYRDRPAPPADAPPERIGRGTTAFAVVDADGNMIAVTQTLSTWGGTFYVSDGLGFLYNNHLRFGGGAPRPLPAAGQVVVDDACRRSCSSRLARPQRSGLHALRSAPPATTGSRRRSTTSSSTSSTAAWTRSTPSRRRAFSSAAIRPTPARAGRRSRIASRASVLENLTARGHHFQKIGRKGEVRYGYAAAAVVDVERRQVQGGAEPRRSHAAVAVGAATTAPSARASIATS